MSARRGKSGGRTGGKTPDAAARGRAGGETPDAAARGRAGGKTPDAAARGRAGDKTPDAAARGRAGGAARLLRNAAGAAAALWQLCWGLPQTLAGAAVLLGVLCAGRRAKDGTGPARRPVWLPERGAAAIPWTGGAGMALGCFVFVPPGADERLLHHELGHVRQSLALGPLYLPLVGLPSLLWCRLPACERRRARSGRSYYSFYTERWADRWGGVRR